MTSTNSLGRLPAGGSGKLSWKTTPASVSTGNGSFYVTNDYGNTADAVDAANALIAGLARDAVTYAIHLLQNDSQPGLRLRHVPPTLRKVPEPAPLIAGRVRR